MIKEKNFLINTLIKEAVSIRPSILTRILNKDGRLERKSGQVWIDKQNLMYVFRKSTYALDQFSVDIHDFLSRELEKDSNKYPSLPEFSDGAFEDYLVGGIRCSTRVENKKFLESLKDRFAPLK